MNVTFSCPHCHRTVRRVFTPSTKTLDCRFCGQSITIAPGSIVDRQFHRCLVCPSRDLYIRKDMPQRLGAVVVLMGVVASSIAWAYHELYLTFAILFGTALIDFLLYFVMGNALICYRCHAQYRGGDQLDAHGAFNLDTHERYRQLSARLSHAGTTPPLAQKD